MQQIKFECAQVVKPQPSHIHFLDRRPYHQNKVSCPDLIIYTQLTKGPITWRISAQAEISDRPPGWNFVGITWRISARGQCLKLGGKRLQESVLHSHLKRCACPRSYFSPGWNLNAITWGFSARLWNRAGNFSPDWNSAQVETLFM